MLKRNEISLVFIIVSLVFFPGCAKKDLILDMGGGDSIRLVGEADSFYCDDPAYAKVDKEVTSILQFADGDTRRLCSPKVTPAKSNSESQGHKMLEPAFGVRPTPPSVPASAP